jgi:hypothetical protein
MMQVAARRVYLGMLCAAALIAPASCGFLDVGQSDAILIRESGNAFVPVPGRVNAFRTCPGTGRAAQSSEDRR